MKTLFDDPSPKKDDKYKPNYIFLPTQRKFNKIIDDIMKLNFWMFDTETTGLCPHDNEVILMQIGNNDIQYLIDTREVTNLSSLKERMEDESFVKILHNALFDYLMIKGTFGISVEGMQCTQLGEQLLKAGLMKKGFSMADCCSRYLKIVIDKEMQTSFKNHTGPFSQRQLEYAALDCIYPYYYAIMQRNALIQNNLVDIFQLENEAIPAFGDMEFYGMLLDKEQWRKNLVEEEKKRQKSRKLFMEEAAKYAQPDIFGEASINPASPTQVLGLFKTMFDHKYLKSEPSNPNSNKLGTGEGVMKKLKEVYNSPKIVTLLEAYREHDKKAGTYGESYIEHIHPKTGRFHPELFQIGSYTGRPSCKKPSMLNIPAESRYRKAWIAGPGRKLLTNDYSACELRIMASMSKDPAMCKGFNDGVDYHTYTASQFIEDNEEWLREYIPHPKNEVGKGKKGNYVLDSNGNKIKNPNRGSLIKYETVCSNERNVAKAINFGLAYGQGAKALGESLGISTDKAKGYIKKFNTKFKTLVQWLDRQKELAYKDSVAITELGRKRFFWRPHKPVWRDEWDDLRNQGCDFANPFDPKLPPEYKSYYSKIASTKREGVNSPIQGGNVDITKIAMANLRKFIKDFEKKHNNGNYLAHVALQVYDEIVVDCPEQYAEIFAKKMEEIMEKAGQQVIKGIPVETDCVIEDFWAKG